MRKALGAIASAALAGLLAGPALGEAPRPAPYELVRALEALQDQAAAGNKAAYAARPKLIAEIAAKLLAAEPEAWRDPRNARAVASYVLTGGDARVLRRLLQLNLLPKADDKLMRAVLAYAEGRVPEAKLLMADIDIQSLPASLGGQVALAQASLLMTDDRHKAVDLLDLARLLLPGTLVEEAALRREIVAMGDIGTIEKFLSLSEQYAHRFPRSVYAESFLQDLAAAISKLGSGTEGATLRRLEALLGELGPEDQRRVFLAIAETATTDGKTKMARFAAEHAARLSQPGSVEEARAKLYLAASLIVGDDYDKAVELLDGLARAPLSKADAQLRLAVLGVAKLLRAWPTAQPPPETKTAALQDGPPVPVLVSSAATIGLAKKSLSETDQLLHRGPR